MAQLSRGRGGTIRKELLGAASETCGRCLLTEDGTTLPAGDSFIRIVQLRNREEKKGDWKKRSHTEI